MNNIREKVKRNVLEKKCDFKFRVDRIGWHYARWVVIDPPKFKRVVWEPILENLYYSDRYALEVSKTLLKY